MLAIATRFHGPTDTHGPRYSARVMEGRTSFGGTRRITVDATDHLDSAANHHAAARALILRQAWTAANNYGPWIIGATDEGYVYVCDNGGRDRLSLEGL